MQALEISFLQEPYLYYTLYSVHIVLY